MAHASHDTAHAHDSHAHDDHAHEAHGHEAHGHAVADDGSADGPIGWPLALLIGIATLAGTLWALLSH